MSLRSSLRCTLALAVGLAGLSLALEEPALAQQPTPAPPAPSAAPPPPGYPQGYPPPPPGYPQGYPPPPYGYGYVYPYPAQPAAPPQPPQPPAILPYDESKPIPAGYRVVRQSRITLAAIGGGIFVLSYLPAIYVAVVGSALDETTGKRNSNLEKLYVPVVGPFWAAAAPNTSGTAIFWLATLGSAETAGLGLGLTGLLLPDEKKLYRNDVRLHVAPMVGYGQAGLSLTGQF